MTTHARRLAPIVGLAAAASCAMPGPDDAEMGEGTAFVRVGERAPAEVAGDPAGSALAYAAARAPALGLGDGGGFEVMSVAPGPGDTRYVRLRQLHGGLPVVGADLVARVSEMEVWGLGGAIAPELEPLAAEPRLERAQALVLAKRAHARAAGARDIEYARERAELVVYPAAEGRPRLAWEVELYAELQPATPPARLIQVLDAATGEVLRSYDAIAAVAHASGPGGNDRVERFWREALEVSESGGAYRMVTPRLETVTMGGRSSGAGAAVEGPLDCIGDRAANDAHGFAAATLDMLGAWMGRDSIDGRGARVRSRVHYGEAYANAFWDGEQVTYGDGGDTFYALSGDASVVAHELHHGFTEHHAGLAFKGQSGALNESFSDVAGVALSYFLDGRLGVRPRFVVGADVVREPGDALRDLCNPVSDGRSIDHADDYAPGMFIHAASGVPNKAFCLAAHELSGGGDATAQGVRRAARAWVEANAGFWTQTTDFEEGCRGILAAAESLEYEDWELEVIADAWADVGVICR